MTPKEKAEELIKDFFIFTDDKFIAKQCVLIAVDEIINQWLNEEGRTAKLNYWTEVKLEIEKL